MFWKENMTSFDDFQFANSKDPCEEVIINTKSWGLRRLVAMF